MKKLEFQDKIADSQENVFLIDWLTFTAHGCSLDDIKCMLGMTRADIPWENTEKFRNGYPLQCFWNGITISYGADDERFYKDPSKARSDMGICVNLSGTGCRAFESFGSGDWFKLLAELFTLRDSGRRQKKGRLYSYNITRLDLAYDDHNELLDIYRIEQDTRHRYYVSKSKYSEIVWSDDQDDDIQGMTIQVGSDKSDVKIRIYDKAAERGFKDRHWIRVELQLRDDRASNAASSLVEKMDIGTTVCGILRTYLTFREYSEDSNKSRWPIAEYWENVLQNMAAIRLWISPGEPYNFRKTEYYLMKQYGQAIVVMDKLYDGSNYLVDTCKDMYPLDDLAPKYKKFLADVRRPSPESEITIVVPPIDGVYHANAVHDFVLDYDALFREHAEDLDREKMASENAAAEQLELEDM